MRQRWKTWLALTLAAIAVAAPAAAVTGSGPVLHEKIPADPREDLAFSVQAEGDLPSALDTPSGIVRAPDARKPIRPTDPSTNHNLETAPDATFKPDRDTHRPDVLPYNDPFEPSTAPFKRLMAFDMVDADYTLLVRDGRMQPVPIRVSPAGDGSEEQFFGNLLIELRPGRRVRVPSVGPGARVVRAHAAVEGHDVPFRLFHDGAENMFIEGDTATRARLVMELSIPRAAFGGEFGDSTWAAMPPVLALPPNVARSAAEVAKKLGLSRALRPREVVAKLVAHFRSFTDSNEPPTGGRDIYLDLALSKKGVCRHRAFAFMVTALSLGIPTRMVINEAHAWVEVHDATLWRRIDLGGAGNALAGQVEPTVAHKPPPDPFAWPEDSQRGADLADRTRRSGATDSADAGTAPAPRPRLGDGGAGGEMPGGGATPSSSGATMSPVPAPGPDGGTASTAEKDERPASTVKLALTDSDVHRGAPLRVQGQVTANGEICAHVGVEIVLRDSKRVREIVIGGAATDDKGLYTGVVVLPTAMPLGDYDVFARTPGDARCGRGGGP